MSKQTGPTWVCKCPRTLPEYVPFCKRCGASLSKKGKK